MLANWQLPARGFVQPSPPPLSLRCRGLTFGSFSWAQLWSDLNSKNGNLPNFLSSFKCTENWGLNRTKFTAPLSEKKIMSDIKSKYKILLDPRAVVNAKKIVPLKNEELIPWHEWSCRHETNVNLCGIIPLTFHRTSFYAPLIYFIKMKNSWKIIFFVWTTQNMNIAWQQWFPKYIHHVHFLPLAWIRNSLAEE